MPSFKALVVALSHAEGATLRDDGHEITVDAPAGKQWVDGGCLQLVAAPWQAEDGSWTSRLQLWHDLWERMKCGLEDEQ